MPENQPNDIYDYPMSDTFISETRRVPYQKGFHSRRHPRHPDPRYLNSLSDREFDMIKRNGFRTPDADTDYLDLITELQVEVLQLRSEVRELRSLVDGGAPKPIPGRGLDVTPRT